VSYAKSGSLNIAYQTVGDGSSDIVFLPGWVSHLDLAWEEPHLAYFLTRLGKIGRLIVFDKRGTGLSDPVASHQTLEDRLGDIVAVMDAVGSERATLFGVSGGGTMAIAFAARTPDRVESLVLHSAVACLMASDGYPLGWTSDFFETVVDSMVETWGDSKVPGIGFINPSVASDDRFEQWLARYMRAAASPAMVRELMWFDRDLDVRADLGGISAPTLVTLRRGETWVDPEQSRYIARSIPGAQLEEVEGSDHWPWLGNADDILDAVEGFITGRRPRRRAASHQVGPAALSRRQREVVRLAIHGLSAAEIADDLKIGERTVETHLANAYRKLGVSSRLELLRRYGDLPIT
jgi:pimeloyl-ACP methyl ester carboxylesterase/DNA-binding CsgD family transcriptional regulator